MAAVEELPDEEFQGLEGDELERYLTQGLGSWEKTLENLLLTVREDTRRFLTKSAEMDLTNQKLSQSIARIRQELRGQFVANVPLLSAKVLSPEVQFRLVGKLRPINYDKGHFIVKQGEVGSSLHIIERGSCEVLKKVNGREITVSFLGKGHFFGEVSVLYDIPRNASVRAVTSVTALMLKREDLLSVITEEELERIKTVARTQVFGTIPLLAGLSSETKIRIAEKLERLRYFKGSTVALPGQITSRLVIIEEGTVLMQQGDRGQLPTFMSTESDPSGIVLSPGSYFGMRGLLYQAPIGFNITATSDELLTLSISLEEILQQAGPEGPEGLRHLLRSNMRDYVMRLIPQLKHLPEASFRRVLRDTEEVKFQKWEVVYAKDVTLDCVYVLECGRLMEYDGDANALSELLDTEVQCQEKATPGEHFGVECLSNLSACASHTLVALTDLVMLKLRAETVWQVLHEHREHITKIPFFSVLSKAEQYLLVGLMLPWTFSSGQSIMEEGQIGDMMYIIESGVCDATTTNEYGEEVVQKLRKGHFFGELAVLHDAPRSLAVKAATDVVALSLARKDIESTLEEAAIEKMRQFAASQTGLGAAGSQ